MFSSQILHTNFSAEARGTVKARNLLLSSVLHIIHTLGTGCSLTTFICLQLYFSHVKPCLYACMANLTLFPSFLSS